MLCCCWLLVVILFVKDNWLVGWLVAVFVPQFHSQHISKSDFHLFIECSIHLSLSAYTFYSLFTVVIKSLFRKYKMVNTITK